jgi:uncharacterized protein (DUF433 family)
MSIGREGAMTDSNTVVAAFSADQVAKLTGLTMRQLAYWDETGFFKPQHAAENRRSPYSRIYSFNDIVGLRTISVLKNGQGVSMKHLKETAARLSRYTKRPWSDVKLSVWNKEVTWIDPDIGVPASVVSGQGVLFELISVIEDMKRETERLRKRSSDEIGKVVRKRNIAQNRPVFAGTRVPVSAVLSFSEAGYSVDDILKEYPSLTREDIDAALREKAARTAA